MREDISVAGWSLRLPSFRGICRYASSYRIRISECGIRNCKSWFI